MGSENTIRTGTTRPKKSFGVGSSTLSSILPNATKNYGIVRAVDSETREIKYTPIINNLASNKIASAFPMNTNMVHLPKPGYVVRLEVGPNIDITVPGASGTNTVYYDPNPIGVWNSVNDNTIEVATSTSPKTPDVKVNKDNINQSQIGLPNGQ
jgi:hypothetical protein